MSKTKYLIEVIDYQTNEVVKTMETTSQRQADRIEDGLNINLNHDAFFTRTVEVRSEA